MTATATLAWKYTQAKKLDHKIQGILSICIVMKSKKCCLHKHIGHIGNSSTNSILNKSLTLQSPTRCYTAALFWSQDQSKELLSRAGADSYFSLQYQLPSTEQTIHGHSCLCSKPSWLAYLSSNLDPQDNTNFESAYLPFFQGGSLLPSSLAGNIYFEGLVRSVKNTQIILISKRERKSASKRSS